MRKRGRGMCLDVIVTLWARLTKHYYAASGNCVHIFVTKLDAGCSTLLNVMRYGMWIDSAMEGKPTEYAFGVIIISIIIFLDSEFTLSNIGVILKDITDYYMLGVHLNVPPREITKIERDYPGTSRRLMEVIDYWMRNGKKPSWDVLAKAVEKMGSHYNIARKIRELEARKKGR